MTWRAAYVDTLLGDLFSLVASFLTGLDLLRLSHANHKLLCALLAPDVLEWQRRVVPSVAAVTGTGTAHCTAKARYFQLTSVRFLGREQAESTIRDRGGAVEVWRQGLPSYWTSSSFSIALTFALLPSTSHSSKPTHIGGILLGAQSVPWSTRRWAESHQQFIHVDPLGNLYCSVLDKKTVVVEKLSLQRWYHVVLTFDRSGTELSELPIQRVFVDGALVEETTGSLHSEWWNLRFGQLGSGCISGGAPGSPTANFIGWYGFHGVVDDCRLWRGALQADAIQVLRRGDLPALLNQEAPELEWSLRESGCDPLGLATRVRCTRPQERVCTDVRDVKDHDE